MFPTIPSLRSPDSAPRNLFTIPIPSVQSWTTTEKKKKKRAKKGYVYCFFGEDLSHKDFKNYPTIVFPILFTQIRRINWEKSEKMVSNHLLLEEPIRMASILEPSKAVIFFSFFFFHPFDFSWDLMFPYGVYGSYMFVLLWCGFVRVQSYFPAMTKIVGTLGPRSRTPEVISACLKAGMSGKFSIFILEYYFLNFCLLQMMFTER